MSKLTARVVLSVLLSLGVIFAIYTTVQGASANAVAEKIGSHSVSGLLTNFNHDRLTVEEQDAYQSQMDALNSPKSGSGHGCESESFNNPAD